MKELVSLGLLRSSHSKLAEAGCTKPGLASKPIADTMTKDCFITRESTTKKYYPQHQRYTTTDYYYFVAMNTARVNTEWFAAKAAITTMW